MSRQATSAPGAAKAGTGSSPAERLARAVPEFQRLRDLRIRAEADLANQEQALAERRQEAEASYGTSDPAELLRRADELDAAAHEELAGFEEQLRSIDQGLRDVESELR